MSRVPWLTIALAIAMIAGTVTIGLDAGAKAGEARARVVRAIDFFAEHPYVEPGPDFRRLFGDARIEALRAAFEAEGGVVPGRFSLVQAQDDWNQLAAAALVRAADTPDTAYGVRPGSPPETLVAHAFADASLQAVAVSVLFLLCAGGMLELALGSAIFGATCAGLLAGTGFLYTVLFPAATAPWLGSSAFVAALLGVYLVVSFGRFSLPGWALLPAWGLAEYLGARGLRIADIATLDPTVPTMHAAGLAVGVGTGALLLAFVVGQRHVQAAAEERELVSNPVLERAMRAREAGQTAQALQWLSAAWSADRKNLDLAVAYWDVARESSSANEALPAALVVLEHFLRNGQSAQALAQWSEIVSHTERIQGDPRSFVRVGELLVEDGQLQRAGVAMEAALANDPSPALALCIVQALEASHPRLASEAARIALGDPKLTATRRAELEALEVAGRAASPEQAQAERALDLSPTDASLAEAPDTELIDPGALSLDQLGADVGDGTRDAGPQPSDASVDLEPLEDTGESLSLDEAPGRAAAAADVASLMPALDLESSGPGEPAAGVPEETLSGSELDAESLALSLGGRSLRRIHAAPVALDSEGLTLRTGKGERRIGFSAVEALAVGAVEGEGPKPVLVIDLVLNWMALADEPLRVIRLRSDRMNARALVPEATGAGDALRILIEAVREHSGAAPLPDADGVAGRPFARFSSLAAYEERVLGAAPA